MAYVSTRIKKSAAEAFEAEPVVAGEIALIKPEGMLAPVDIEPPLLFRAYSKEFGEAPNARVRRIAADVSLLPKVNVRKAAAEIRRSADSVVSESGSDGSLELRTKETAGKARFDGFYKLIGRGPDTFQLRIIALDDEGPSGEDKAREMLDSFRLKDEV